MLFGGFERALLLYLFSSRLAEQILNEWGPAKLIYGNNCIAHLDNLKDLTKESQSF